MSKEFEFELGKHELAAEAMAYMKSGGKKLGYEAGEAVRDWFKMNTEHPHPTWTLENMGGNRDMKEDNTIVFAAELAWNMAHLVAMNEGWSKNKLIEVEYNEDGTREVYVWGVK